MTSTGNKSKISRLLLYLNFSQILIINILMSTNRSILGSMKEINLTKKILILLGTLIKWRLSLVKTLYRRSWKKLKREKWSKGRSRGLI